MKKVLDGKAAEPIELRIRSFKQEGTIATALLEEHHLQPCEDTGFAPIGLDEPYRIVVGNNPVNFVDPLGLETTIVITRGTPMSSSTPGTITVTATNTTSTFSGYTLEPPPNGKYNRIPAGTYSAYQRSQSSTGKKYNPNRIQLNNVDGMTGAQIHVGNVPDETKGCVLAGTSAGTNNVGGSKDAMTTINKIIKEDGGSITVIIK